MTADYVLDRKGVEVRPGDRIAFNYKGSGSWGNGSGLQSGHGTVDRITAKSLIVSEGMRTWRLARDARITRIEAQ